jgi:hypothetical protein
VATNGQEIVECLRAIPGQGHVCFEEGTQSGWLYEILEPHAVEVVVAGVEAVAGDQRTTSGMPLVWPRTCVALVSAVAWRSCTGHWPARLQPWRASIPVYGCSCGRAPCPSPAPASPTPRFPQSTHVTPSRPVPPSQVNQRWPTPRCHRRWITTLRDGQQLLLTRRSTRSSLGRGQEGIIGTAITLRLDRVGWLVTSTEDAALSERRPRAGKGPTTKARSGGADWPPCATKSGAPAVRSSVRRRARLCSSPSAGGSFPGDPVGQLTVGA